MSPRLGENSDYETLAGYFVNLSSLCEDLPSEASYGPILMPGAPGALAVLDVYQTRALQKQFNVFSIGVRDAVQALEFLDPVAVVFQTTKSTLHPAWSGRLASSDVPNAHLVQLTESASKLDVPIVALCTVPPDQVGDYLPSLSTAQIVLVARTDTCAALRNHRIPGADVLSPSDIADTVNRRRTAGISQDSLIERLGYTYFSTAIARRASALSSGAAGDA